MKHFFESGSGHLLLQNKIKDMFEFMSQLMFECAHVEDLRSFNICFVTASSSCERHKCKLRVKDVNGSSGDIDCAETSCESEQPCVAFNSVIL